MDLPGHCEFLDTKTEVVQNIWFFNYFRHDKSEPHFTDDCMFTVFLNFIPNRFRLKMEPRELVWKNVTAIPHMIFLSIFIGIGRPPDPMYPILFGDFFR